MDPIHKNLVSKICKKYQEEKIMWTLLFIILMLGIFGRMIGFAFRATWGITKVLFNLVLLPLFLICLVIAGFMYLALPILVIVGVVMLVGKIVS